MIGDSTKDLLDEQAAEIERLQAAKRAALAIANERSYENAALRALVSDISAGNFVDANDLVDRAQKLIIELYSDEQRVCPSCDGKGLVIQDSEWEPVAVRCPTCNGQADR